MNRARLSLSVIVFIVAAAIAVVVSTSSRTSKALSAPGATAAISVRQTSVGRVLTDANGRTLYLFAGDTPDVSTLSSAGRAVWPPVTSPARPAAIGGADPGNIGAVNGTGVGAQITYRGHPLYYFVGDSQPGQVAGQGLNEFGGRWYVLSSAGTAITSVPQPAVKSSSTGSGSAYGY